MFFYIGDLCPNDSLIQVESRLYLDQGWNEIDGIWYKGYSTDCILKDAVRDIVKGYQPNGKWCVIYKSQIYHPKFRGFPLYRKGLDFTNLVYDGFENVLYDNIPLIEGSLITLDEASTLIGDVLVENISNFLRYNSFDDIEVMLSGGLDTTTIWAVLDSITKNYSLNIYLPDWSEKTVLEWMGCKRDYESELISKISSDCWGYYHLPIRSTENWTIGGYYAETIQYRDAVAINALANYHGKYIDDFANEEDYLYWFLKRPSSETFKNEILKFDGEDHIKRYLYDTVFYDFQMWHVDNNFIVSPFYDIRIPHIMNRLSIEDIAHNAVTGQIQRNIITRFKPEVLKILSDYKNTGDNWANFRKYFDQDSMLHANTKIIYR